MNTWAFTDLEFVVLWESVSSDLLPAPLMFTSRTPLRDDFERERTATRNALRERVNGAVGALFETLADPDVCIMVSGASSADLGDAAARIRLLGVRRGRTGYLVKQLPGETIWHSGGYRVTETDAVSLADAMVAELPVVSAGRRNGVVLVHRALRDSMDYTYGREEGFDTGEETVEQQSAAFLRAPIAGGGSIEIRQGRSVYGPRGLTIRRLAWRDLAADGRYVISSADPPVADGVDAKRLCHAINREIADIVRAIKEEPR